MAKVLDLPAVPPFSVSDHRTGFLNIRTNRFNSRTNRFKFSPIPYAVDTFNSSNNG
jgi:hypothetical protein